MDGIRVDVVEGAFAGTEAVLVSHEGDRVLVLVTVLGRQVPVELPPGVVHIEGLAPGAGDDTHAALRDRITLEHDRLAEAEAFAFFLDRVGTAESDPAAEWDAYIAHRAEVRARAEARKAAALERFDHELAERPADEARRVVHGDPAFWLPGCAVVAAQRRRTDADEDERLLAAIDAGRAQDYDGSDSLHDRAGNRLNRARMAADAGNPTVTGWAFRDRLAGERKQFWDRLDSTAIRVIFGP